MQLKKIIKTMINNNISFHYERFLLKKKNKTTKQTDHLCGKGQTSQGKEESNCNFIIKLSTTGFFSVHCKNFSLSGLLHEKYCGNALQRRAAAAL